MKLKSIAERYQEAKEFLDYMMSRNIYLLNGKIKKPNKRGYYWDLACYYAGIRGVSNGGSDKFLNVIKPRGCGITTFNAAYASFLASKGKNVLFVGLNNGIAKDFIDKCDSFSFCCSKPSANELSFPFWDGRKPGKIVAKSQNEESYHGESVDLVILDEFASFHQRKIERVRHSVLPMAAFYGKIISASTPNKVEFTDMCDKHGHYSIPQAEGFFYDGL